MKSRIAMWAGAGFSVAVGWALYAYATHPPALTSADPMLALAEITCPIAFASMHFHFSVSLYACLITNAATYGLVGLAIKSVRRGLNPAR
ncbi:MAG TPA: hypothetical protein VEJ00_15020 [Candidatus Acidoferrales bacterium]|nr:hypothetical protein [Candidatus Acidoferrales bacterium]HXY05264.1 hypothetical protein [Burkholderiaceae bacterium]